MRAVSRLFGTDGVRGVANRDLTAELAFALGRAAAQALAAGPRPRIVVGRDTRASGVELEEAFGRGVADAGGSAVLAGVLPTPVVRLNRAVAVAEAGDVEAALALVERLELDRYHYLHATRAELLRRLDRRDEARAAYARALELVHSDAERRFLERRLAELEG